MDLEQYIGCIINYRGRMAEVTDARSNYDGEWFYLKYLDTGTYFAKNAFDRELMRALPDPLYGLIKRRGDSVLFFYGGVEYELGDHPYEPCLYIRKDGAVFRTLHNAFTAYDLPEYFAEGKTLTAVDGSVYDCKAFCRVLACTVDGTRTEMDFTYAAGLVK